MNVLDKKVNIGVVGLGQRGVVLIENLFVCDEAKIVAVCDVYDDRCDKCVEMVKDKKGNTPSKYRNYNELIDDKEVDVVLICTSWEHHIDIAIKSMLKGKPVGLEVGGAYSIEDCFKLVDIYEKTNTPIMMMENCCWDRFELLSTSLARNNKLGEIVYCHGAYSHDLRDEILGGNVNRHYRLKNYINRNCDNYPTHELGPIAKLLNINRGNTLTSLVTMSSKAVGLSEFAKTEKNPDPSLSSQEFKQGDIVTTMIKCANGELITLKLDTTLPKYYSREFTVRGTKGLCNQEANMVLLENLVNFHEYDGPENTIKKYLNNAVEFDKYLPEEWKNITPEEKKLGHGGMDYFMLKSFLHNIMEGNEMPIDVYDAALWMSITILSEKSIALGGQVMEIPDFTKGKWKTRPQKDVTKLPIFGDNNEN